MVAEIKNMDPYFFNANNYVLENKAAFVNTSKELATQILHPKPLPQTSSRSLFSGFTWISLGNTTYIDRGYRRPTNEPSSDARVLAGIIGAVVGGFALFFFGQKLREKEENEALLAQAKEMKSASSEIGNDDLRRLSLKVVDLTKKKQQSLYWSVATKAALVAASALALGGAIFASSVLITTGLVLGLATLSVCIFRMSYSDAKLDAQIKMDARNVQALAEKILL